LEHLACSYLAQLAQDVQVLRTTAWKTTKTLHLYLCKIRQVQAIEEGNYKRWTHFCNWFLQLVHDSLLDLKHTFFSDEVWFHLSRYISAQNNRYWSSINLRQTFEVPLHDQKIGVWCAITAIWIVGLTHIFKKKKQQYVSDILWPYFFFVGGALWEERHGCFVQGGATAHTVAYSVNI
jgi:hypothetical protein